MQAPSGVGEHAPGSRLNLLYTETLSVLVSDVHCLWLHTWFPEWICTVQRLYFRLYSLWF